MTITTTNALSFKESLKDNKDLFYGSFVKAYLGDISNLLSSGYPSGTDALTPVKIVLFSYNETIDIQSKLLVDELIYLPGTSNDRVILRNGTATRTFTFDANGNPIGASVGQLYTIGDRKFRVESTGGLLLTTLSSPSYAITEDTTSVNEGETVTFTITTTNISNGTGISWSTTGTCSGPDFTDNTLSGVVTINNNSATLTRTIANDFTLNNTEGAESFAITLNDGSGVVATSNTISVADTSTATYSVTGAATVIEGNSITYTVTTSGVPDNTTLFFTTSGTAATAADINPSSGAFVIINNSGSFSINFEQDLTSDDNEQVNVNIRISGINGDIVATSTTTITDAPFTVTITPTATSVNESSATLNSNVTLNVTTTGVPDGTTLNTSITGTGITIGGDFAGAPSVTINNDAGQLFLTVQRDGRTEGSEEFVVNILDTAGQIVASTPPITINDTSYIGLNHTGKTYGPIRINRDSGNTAFASDIYAICNLDQLPDGSKVAIFIDNSGSMTTQTIQAAYDDLIAKLQARNMDVITVTNTNEDWITPFNQILT